MERDCCLAEDRRWSAATRSRCVRCPRAALRCAECGVAHRLGGLLPGLALSRSRVRSKTAAAAAIDTATPTETDTLSSWSGGSELVPRRLPPTDGGRKAADRPVLSEGGVGALPVRSENNTNFSSNAQEKAATRGGQRGALQFSVGFSVLYSQRIQPPSDL
jgi:hypothetical protein